MGDLRRGRHIGTDVELAIWATLSNRSDIVRTLDKAFSNWNDNKQEQTFPKMFEDAFQDYRDTT